VHYAIFFLIGRAPRGNTSWQPGWRNAELKPAYDVVIVDRLPTALDTRQSTRCFTSKARRRMGT
jgi:hypothetical protein